MSSPLSVDLDQHGRTTRADEIPLIAFWTAAAAHAHPADLNRLGDAAWNRGLYRDATRLHKNSTTHGDRWAGRSLVGHLHALHPTDHRPATFTAAHIVLDEPNAVASLLKKLREVGADDQMSVLLARDPAAHVTLDDSFSVGRLLQVLPAVRADDQASVLLARDPAAHIVLDDPGAIGRLLGGRGGRPGDRPGRPVADCGHVRPVSGSSATMR